MNGMSYGLLGAIISGLGAGAVIFALMHSARKAGHPLPKWLLPAGIAFAMVGYSVWNDYSWLGRTQEQLPEGTEVLLVGRNSQIWAPWTYIAPVAIRFAALDPAKISDEAGGIRQAEVMLVERHKPMVIVRQQFDCAKGLISIGGRDWQEGGEDPAMRHVCPAEAQ